MDVRAPLFTLLLSGSIAVALSSVPTSARQAQPAAPARAIPPPAAKAVLDTYCVTCHNQRLRTAGLALDKLDVSRPGANAEVWEQVIAKLRAGSMPPPGRPRPDAATYHAVASCAGDTKSIARGRPIRIPAGSARSIASIAPNTTTRFATCSRSTST